MAVCPDQAVLDAIFPPERADQFFEALYGGAEEGAYDIRLICEGVSDTEARLAFNLAQRPGQCLRCSLTYGLPQVFQRHPILNVEQVARDAAQALGWAKASYEIGATRDLGPELHQIPLLLHRKDDV